MPPSPPMYLEDLSVGQTFRSATASVDTDQIRQFAAQFDPQPFHLDETAGRESLFGGLVASGWHTAALTMRLMVQGEFRVVGGLVGAGVESIRWPRPVRPGDVLRVESEIVEIRTSKSNPDRGTVRVQSTTFNQHNQAVMSQVAFVIVPRRPDQAVSG
jgi:acyl dehydratase